MASRVAFSALDSASGISDHLENPRDSATLPRLLQTDWNWTFRAVQFARWMSKILLNGCDGVLMKWIGDSGLSAWREREVQLQSNLIGPVHYLQGLKIESNQLGRFHIMEV